MPSFDIVSEVDLVEIRNAVEQTNKVVHSRFDFKGSSARIETDSYTLTLFADNDFQRQQLYSLLCQKLSKRNIDLRCLSNHDSEKIAGNKIKQQITINVGINADLAKKIITLIKQDKLKVQASIQGDRLRISGPKRDILQQVISLIRGAIQDTPLQYDNFRD